VSLGKRAGTSWQQARFAGPYLRDELLGLGVFVETLETAHTWSRLDELYRAVGDALRGALGSASIVMCHISHAYEDGASLYHLLRPRPPGRRLEQWGGEDAVWRRSPPATDHHTPRRQPRPRSLHGRRDGELTRRVARRRGASILPGS
jgi:alkyldihydroxyacetonephosphate synthase